MDERFPEIKILIFFTFTAHSLSDSFGGKIGLPTLLEFRQIIWGQSPLTP
jgi:hypothetical protein